jgi:ATP-dependent RNA helicase DDX54/DBP10
VGEQEGEGVRGSRSFGPGGKKFKHNKVTDAKPLDKLAKDYDRKVRQLKKKNEDVVGESNRPSAKKGTKPGGRYGGKPISKVKSELKTTDQIRKNRSALENRRAKNGRHATRKKGGRR